MHMSITVEYLQQLGSTEGNKCLKVDKRLKMDLCKNKNYRHQ